MLLMGWPWSMAIRMQNSLNQEMQEKEKSQEAEEENLSYCINQESDETNTKMKAK